MKKIIAATLIAAASLSASAQSPVAVSKDFQINEASSGTFSYVDYVAKRSFNLKEQSKAMTAVLKDACGREDSKQGFYPTVSVLFGKTVLPVAVNAGSCEK